MRRISVITDRCRKELHCIAVCLRNAIQPAASEPGFAGARQLFIHPKRCLGCGACISACENGAIVEVEESPEAMVPFADLNAESCA